MAINKKSLENLKKGKATQFSKENQPKNNGRRRNVIAQYIKDHDVSLDDIKAVITNLMFAYTPDEIKEFLKEKDKDKKPPIGVIMILKALLSGMERGDLDNWGTLMDRAYGKSSQKVDITSGNMPLTSMSTEDRQKRIDVLLRKSRANGKKSTTGKS